jgi:hypothetical protein
MSDKPAAAAVVHLSIPRAVKIKDAICNHAMQLVVLHFYLVAIFN